MGRFSRQLSLVGTCSLLAEGARVNINVHSHDDFEHDYPLCHKELKRTGKTLEDIQLPMNRVDEILATKNDCNWWSSQECKESWLHGLANDFYLRKSLVGQEDPRGPTLYHPEAQRLVMETMRKLGTEMRKEGKVDPDINFLTQVFRGINVEDEGDMKTWIGNKFASIFNRASADTDFRAKDVTTKFYDLATWGTTKEAIEAFNPQTYQDESGNSMRALELSHWRFLGTNFVYKLPPQGIEHELQKIVDAWVKGFHAATTKTEIFDLIEKYLRDYVILHPYTDANGRSARVSMNILLLLNGLPPIVMQRQDEDMSAPPADFRDRICEGMVHSLTLSEVKELEVSTPDESNTGHCCTAKYSLDDNKEWCVSIPEQVTCDAYGTYTQSKKYKPWADHQGCAGGVATEQVCSEE